ncbi:sensor histidine kinase [Actinocorallia aurantiaca]|uniref:histidine kinase n=1 Tax=Actinocorallia aurantiaca TaxID=46204 RepID=A0ABN3U8H6_9ACTN
MSRNGRAERGGRWEEGSAARDSPGRPVLLCAAAAAAAAALLFVLPDTLAAGLPACAAAAAALMRWPYRGVTLTAAVAATVTVSLVVSAAYRGPQDPLELWSMVEFPALLVLAGRAVRRTPPRRAGGLVTAISVVVLALALRPALLTSDDEWLKASFVGSALFLFPVACAVGVGAYLRGLDRRRVRAVGEARRAQRLSLARDLHDFVAHEVTGIVLEAQAAQLRDLDAGDARAVQRRIEEAALRALDSMDQTLEALRDPDEQISAGPPPTRLYGLDDLPELVGRFAAPGFPDAVLEFDPDAAGRLTREADGTVYRVVLEALTNVRRHARWANRVEVSARGTASGVEVRVRDDGGARGRISTGLDRMRGSGGTGLAELEARVQGQGGTLSAGPDDAGGWLVVCTMPAARVPHAGKADVPD